MAIAHAGNIYICMYVCMACKINEESYIVHLSFLAGYSNVCRKKAWLSKFETSV